MVATTWQRRSPDALLTREVRWFFDGVVPERVVEWFTSSVHHPYQERRVDTYDLDAASLGIGIKSRNGGPRDSKILLDLVQCDWLAENVEGCVQDWLKLSESGSDRIIAHTQHRLALVKDIVTRDYRLEGGSSGCEVELASVRSGAIAGWSLCFETFGEQERREEALTSCVERFIVESPIPDFVSLRSEFSCSYPEWISRLDLGLNASALRG